MHQKIKKNIQNVIDSSYNNVIDNLKPVIYENTILNKKQIGFIAHELGEHLEFAIDGEKDATQKDASGNDIPKYQTVEYNNIIALCVHEIQQLKKEVKELKEKINSQSSQTTI